MSIARTFGPYVLLERVNVGGMAEVFRAIEKANKREVAIKRLLPSLADDEDFVDMFADEAKIARVLDHPSIATIYDYGQIDRSLYIAMEFVHGRDARSLFDRAEQSAQRVPLDVALYVISHAADGLAYAHAKTGASGEPLHVVHRDVTLQNLLVSFDGEVKLIDFGIAKASFRVARTAAGEIKGKYAYMSPEAVRGLPVDRRTDIFSLGVCLWELLTTTRLFSGATDVVVIEKVRACAIPPPSSIVPSLPREIDRIAMKALAKDADDRYASASELYADLDSFARTHEALADRSRVAAYMRQAFPPEGRGKSLPPPARDTKSVTERKMADNKGSDLDVFEGLTKKPAARPSFPPGPPPPSARNSAALPPPANARPKTMLGIAPPQSTSAPLPPPKTSAPPMPRPTGPGPLSASQLPAPTTTNPGLAPPPVMPPPSRASSVLPPARPTGPLPAVLPPPSRPPSNATGALPPLAPPPTRSAPPVSRPLPPPGAPPPAKAAPPPGASADMDWDDEDEKTSIYDKDETANAMRALSNRPPPPAAGLPPPTPAAGLPPPSGPRSARSGVPGALPPPNSKPNLGAAAALAASSGSAAPPAPLPPPAPVPAIPATIPPSAPTKPAAKGDQDLTQVVRSQSGGGKGAFIAVGVVAALAVAAGLFFFLRPTKGTLIVAVKSGGRPLQNVEVFVDDKKVCDTTPCKVDALERGTRNVKAVAIGYDPGTELVAIRAGEESPVTIEVAKARDAADSAAKAPAGTGFHVTGPAIVKVAVDGKELGPLPQDVKDLTPGEHTVKFYASDRYKADERKITVVENEIKDLGTVKLPVVKGKATLSLETAGATVTLVSGSDRKAVRQFPISIDIDTSKQWVIEATKTGFEDYKQPIDFQDGEAEKSYAITLQEKGKAPKKDDSAAPAIAKSEPAHESSSKSEDKPAAPSTTKEESSSSKDNGGSGQATLSINSIPPSNCILDGRPLGSTPKAGISVSPGTHTVVFVHPDKGKKSASVTVKAGESRSVGVRF